MNTETVIIDEDKLDHAAEVMRALTHDLRLQILSFIDENKNINVNKIYNTLGLEQSITSQHLRILRLAKVVTSERKGKQIFYSVNYDYLHSLVGDISNFLAKI